MNIYLVSLAPDRDMRRLSRLNGITLSNMSHVVEETSRRIRAAMHSLSSFTIVGLLGYNILVVVSVT